jgi:hypothetical protein
LTWRTRTTDGISGSNPAMRRLQLTSWTSGEQAFFADKRYNGRRKGVQAKRPSGSPIPAGATVPRRGRPVRHAGGNDRPVQARPGAPGAAPRLLPAAQATRDARRVRPGAGWR